jgi:Tol biopolymer transport system component
MRYWLWSSARAALTCIPIALAAPPEALSHIFEGRDFFGLQWVTEPQIRPDGATVAYVRVGYDVLTNYRCSSIWLVDVNTGAQTPLASGGGTRSSLSRGPDGKRLAYVSTAGEERAQLFVRWMSTGETARLTDLPDAPTALAWAPDGRSIAFTVFTPDDTAKLGAAPAKPEGSRGRRRSRSSRM